MAKKHRLRSTRRLPGGLAASAAIAGLLSALSVASSANAATQTWDGTASGVWDTLALNWDGGTAAWTSSNNALFSGTPTNNVTTATGLTIGAITLDNTFTGTVTMTGANTVTGATTISGGTLNLNHQTGLGSSAVTVNSGGTVNVTLGSDQNVNNVFTGSGIITATGNAGTPTFSNASGLNGFTGTLNVNTTGGKKVAVNAVGEKIGSGATVNITSAGTLYISNTSTSFDGVTFNVVGSGNTENLGAIRLEQSSVIGATSSVVLGGNTTFGSNSGTGTINAAISESTASNLTKVGSQTLALGGANTYTGTTTISAGTLMIGTGGTTGTLGSGAVTNNATLAFNRSDSVTVGNNISGTGALTKMGSGTVTLTGTVNNSGATTIQAGTLNVGNGTSGTLGTGALTFSNSGKINFNEAAGSSQSIGALTFSAGAGATVQSTYGGSGNTSLTFSNVVARNAGASANFVVSGGTNGTTNKIVFTQVAGGAPSTGTLLDRGYFYNGSSYAAYDSGGFVRAYGSGDTNYVTATGSNSIANTSTNNVALTGNVDTQASASINTLNMGANTLALDTGAAFKTNGILVSGNSASTISGGTSLAATTSGAELVVRVDGSSDALDISTPIIANGANAFTKTGAGTLTLSGTGNAYTGTTTVSAGTLALTGTYTGGGAFNVTAGGTLSGTSSGTNTIGNFSVNGAGASATLTSGTYNINNTSGNNTNINNGGSLTVDGATINTSGTGWLPIGDAQNTTSTLTLNSGAINVSHQNGIQVGRIGYGVLNINGGTLTENSSGNQGVILGDQTTAQGGTVNLNGGTLITRKLSSSNGINAFNFNGGTLQANSTNQGANFWASSLKLTANVRNGGGTISNNGTNITIGQALVHSTISGDNATDGGLIFQGSGTTTLSGANTYTGATTINAGTLAIGAANRIADTSAMVLGGGTFATGGFAETVGTLTINTASVIDFGSGTSALAFANSSANSWTGSLTLTNFDIGTDTLRFGTDATGLTGSQLSAISLSGFTATGLDSSGFVTFTAVPEPHQFALAIVGLLGVMVFMRRRREQA
jgi:autotransporter-associated beta strand protein